MTHGVASSEGVGRGSSSERREWAARGGTVGCSPDASTSRPAASPEGTIGANGQADDVSAGVASRSAGTVASDAFS